MTPAVILIAVVAAILWAIALVRVGLVGARMFQLEEYDTRRLLRWGWTTEGWFGHRAVFGGVLLGWVVAGVGAWRATPWLVAAGWLAGGAAANVLWRWAPPKKALVFTSRARRILITSGVLGSVFVVAASVGVVAFRDIDAAIVVVVALGGLTLWPLLLLIAANGAMTPVEGRNRRAFLRSAAAKMAEVKPVVIAVAGSYGKTTTKRILAHALATATPTLPTPKSFNTLMGITKTINDDLDRSHRAFVVEMDAYNPGEIDAMCRLVHPTVAIITSSGPQHLERFRSMERIEGSLFEAVAALPDDGVAIIYAGDEPSRSLAERARASSTRTVAYGIAGDEGHLDVIARDVVVAGDGTGFTWTWPEENLEYPVRLPLLGRHQALNAAAALAAVHVLGHPLEPAIAALLTLEAVPHRLQVIPTSNAITVIDDSYNANPVGVHNALEVLAEVSARHRILVTPGLVELGVVEDDENRRYGKHAALVCDEVVVVSARTTAAIVAGLEDGGLGPDHVHVVPSLDEATAVISRVAGAGDAVLFANDLPDTY